MLNRHPALPRGRVLEQFRRGARGAVETDRLHVAIAASLLGKRVRIQNNSYGKNRAVYEFRLRDRFPNLE